MLSNLSSRENRFQVAQPFQLGKGNEVDCGVAHFQSKPAFTVTGFSPENHSAKLVFLNPLHLENVFGTGFAVNGVGLAISGSHHIEGLTLTVLCEVMRPKAVPRQAQTELPFKTGAVFAIGVTHGYHLPL